MDVIPRNDYGERCQLDSYCKLVLYHEAIDYLCYAATAFYQKLLRKKMEGN